MNLLYDTWYRRTRYAIAKSVHAADDLLSRARRAERRILFEAASPLSLAVFRPVLTRLQRDPRIEFWFTTSDRSWNAEQTFLQEGIAERVAEPGQIRWMKFDAYVNADFWNTTWLPRHVRRVHLFHGVAGKYGLDAPVAIAPVVRSFDRVMFANADRLGRYIEAGIVEPDGDRAQLVGYPKVDCLVDGSLDRRQIQERLGLSPSRPTVLYAPTWSPHSSLNRVGPALVPALAALDVNVVVKLHDRSFDPRSRTADSPDWRETLDPLCTASRVVAARGSDIGPYLYAADALVTDHSSAGFEFMLLDRPLVVIDCPELIAHARVPDDKVRMLRDAATVASADPRAIARAVETALARPDAHRAERRAAAARLFYRPGTATARAVTCVYDLLGLHAPERLPATDAALSATTITATSGTTHHV